MTKKSIYISIGVIVLIVGCALLAFIKVHIIGIKYPFPSDPGNVLFGKSNIPITLYSLDSTKGRVYPLMEDAILGKIQLSPHEASEALSSGVTSIKEKDTALYTSIMCFFPRHAIEFELSGKKYMFVICYECSQMDAYCDGKPISCPQGLFLNEFRDNRWIFSGSPDKLNALLDKAHIPRDKN